MVAFLQKLPDMTAEHYKEMDKMAGQIDDDEDVHHHDGDSGQDHGDEPDPDHQH